MIKMLNIYLYMPKISYGSSSSIFLIRQYIVWEIAYFSVLHKSLVRYSNSCKKACERSCKSTTNS